MTPTPGGAPEIWYHRPAQWEPERYRGLVSDDEAARAQRFRSGLDAGRFLASRALLRVVVGRLVGVAPTEMTFDRGCAHCGSPDHGRPSLPGAPVQFSLTRAGPVVAVAVGAAPLGLDAEADAPATEDLVDASVFSAAEHGWIRGPDAAATKVRLLAVWVAKEAVGKVGGRGLEGAERIVLPLGADGWARAADADGRTCWVTPVWLPGAAAAAVAVAGPRPSGPSPEPRPFDLEPVTPRRW